MVRECLYLEHYGEYLTKESECTECGWRESNRIPTPIEVIQNNGKKSPFGYK